MKATQQQAYDLTLAHEGGYVNHPKDPGGATNKGVTQRVYDAYRDLKKLPRRSVRLITSIEVAEIYDSQYWDKVQGDDLPAGLDYAVYDYAVNSGVARAVKDLQRTVGAPVDGVMGRVTQDYVKKACEKDDVGLIVAYCERRMKFLRSLRHFGTFGKGWTRRVMGAQPGMQATDNGVIDYAVAMAKKDLQYPLPKDQLPVAIGFYHDEKPGKATETQQAALKTSRGLGAFIASTGVTAQMATSTAEQFRPYADETPIGQIAQFAIIGLTMVGIGLTVYDFWAKQKEKNGTAEVV